MTKGFYVLFKAWFVRKSAHWWFALGMIYGIVVDRVWFS